MNQLSDRFLELADAEAQTDIRIGWHLLTQPDWLLQSAGRITRLRREIVAMTPSDAAYRLNVGVGSIEAFDIGELSEDLAARLPTYERELGLPEGTLVRLVARLKRQTRSVLEAAEVLALCEDIPGPERDAAYAAMLAALGAA